MRPAILANDEIYHIFNRGIDKRPTFTDKREFTRAVVTLDFYRFVNPIMRLSKALVLNKEEKTNLFSDLREKGKKQVDIISYCLMPNHIHFLLKQLLDGGITRFMSNFTNSYTRYFNTKHERRAGPLFQGTFKAVHIEDDEQLLQVHRYIHINPSVSFIVTEKDLINYHWSSLPEYSGKVNYDICSKELIMSNFSSLKNYNKFIFSRIDYAKKLKKIKHLIIE